MFPILTQILSRHPESDRFPGDSVIGLIDYILPIYGNIVNKYFIFYLFFIYILIVYL